MKHNWEALISDFRSSGMSQAEFARSRKVNSSSLSERLKKSMPSGKFLRVETDRKIEIEINGISVRFEERLLGSILKSLNS